MIPMPRIPLTLSLSKGERYVPPLTMLCHTANLAQVRFLL